MDKNIDVNGIKEIIKKNIENVGKNNPLSHSILLINSADMFLKQLKKVRNDYKRRYNSNIYKVYTRNSKKHPLKGRQLGKFLKLKYKQHHDKRNIGTGKRD